MKISSWILAAVAALTARSTHGVQAGRRRSPTLHFLDDDQALCLDGSPGAFYLTPATEGSRSEDTWVIFFEGGGWCFTEEDCLARSRSTALNSVGSTVALGSFPNTNVRYQQSILGGPQAQVCAFNPALCEANFVYLVYCDGNSFAGGRADPLAINGSLVYFRGKRILDAALSALGAFGLDHATEVLVTGDSAGGLATILHADAVAAAVAAQSSSLRKAKALPLSGFFPLLDTVQGLPVFAGQMQQAFATHNASAGVPQACVAAVADPSYVWTCNTSPGALASVATPIFILNSAYDAWATSCIFTLDADEAACGAAPGWGLPCVGDSSPLGTVAAIFGPADLCDEAQVSALNDQWRPGFLASLEATGVLGRNGSGAFVHTCHTHTAENLPLWSTIASDGGEAMVNAVANWWAEDEPAAAKPTYFAPCTWSVAAPHQCNPTCNPLGVLGDVMRTAAA